MKQLILDTRHIIPTGDKNRPVVVRPTLSGRALNLTFAAIMALAAITRLCDGSVDHDTHFYIILVITALGVALLARNAIRGEQPAGQLDTDEYVNLQQFALYIWKQRLQNACLCLAYISLCLSDFSTLVSYTGFAFLAAFFLAKWYFSKQIKQAARLTPDLNLAPRVEITIGLSSFAQKLEAASLASMVVAIAVSLSVGLSCYLTDGFSGFVVWSGCLLFCTVGVTFSLRKLLRQPISLADQAEADEVRRDRWIVPLVGLCLNLLGALTLAVAYLFF